MTKTNYLSSLLMLLCGIALTFTSCLEDDCEATVIYKKYTPIYKTESEIRQEIKAGASRALENPGKIYYYEDYIFINEFEEGIHIIENKNPRQPNPIAFIEIPGNVDMAIRGNLLYADNYTDLVVIELNNPQNPTFVGRTENVFLAHYNMTNFGYLVGYEETEETMERPCDEGIDDVIFNETVLWVNAGVSIDAALDINRRGIANTNTGTGGSMARFTMANQHLYTVDEFSLKVFDLSNSRSPELKNTVQIGWGIETIYPFGDYLFIGSRTGMFIFDNQNPLEPFQLSVYQHWNACDPVVVEGDIAYVTLRNGTECETFANQLDVVDVSDLRNPQLLATYEMHNPHGLSIQNNTLYICENEEGVKVFDAKNWRNIPTSQLDQWKGFQAYDIITLADKTLAMVIGQDGLYQYDISDPAKAENLSVLAVSR